MVYRRIKVNITEAQAKKALAGKPIRIAPSQIGQGTQFVSFHPANAKIIERAAMKGSGCNIHMSCGELADTAHNMNGAGFWGSLWKGIRKGFNWLKDSGTLSAAADAAVAPLAAYTGQPGIVAGARKLLKDTTGVGIKKMTKTQRREVLKGRGLYLS
jgi:hypothetical protein